MSSARPHVILVLLITFSLPHALVNPSAAQTSTCEDLSSIDFGDCEAVLGAGIVDGTCQVIVGCESPVPLFATVDACEATCATCNDLSGVDFGACAMPLGVGVIDGVCQSISGCDSPVPLFTSQTACESLCNVVAVEKRHWGLIKRLYRQE